MKAQRHSFNGHKGCTHPRWAAGLQRYVYAALDTVSGCIKIGCTINVPQRMRLFGRAVRLLGFIPGDYGTEEWIQGRLRAFRAKHHRQHSKEWFDPTPEVLLAVSEMMFVHRAIELGLDVEKVKAA